MSMTMHKTDDTDIFEIIYDDELNDEISAGITPGSSTSKEAFRCDGGRLQQESKDSRR